MTQHTQSVTSALHVPFITQGDCQSSYETSDYTIRTHMYTPLTSRMIDVIIDIAVMEQWKDVFIFYDKSHG